ncbi:extracellular solute-binding protein [Paenibacillus thalictri]|uniref:Extracellular solute-binding protein n=1 Tax=Paenibacillus thalictri TaxID=2527873 RepID=A0A4Q9DT87_9BACL|nr:extracellular solute-binding protein [Paenibacillus thalictri]TBL80108.1 extracellular solute-binding protein [Paenibacillus thalictri]
MTKKRFLLAAAAGLVVVSGCSSAGLKAGSANDSKQRTVKVMFAESPSQKVNNGSPIQNEIARLMNIRLEYEPIAASNYGEKKKILLATGHLPDIVQIEKQDVNDFASSGVFLPLMDYMNRGLMPNFKKQWDALPDLKRLTVDGELYGFPAIARNEAKNGFGPVIRTDLLEKHHIPLPRSFDELLTALGKLKQLYPDSVPWPIRKGTSQLLAAAAYMMGSGYNVSGGMYFDKDVEGGKFVYGPATPAFKQVLAYFQKAYSMGVLDPDYPVTTQQQWTEKLTGGKSFFFLDNSGFGLNFTRDLRKSVPEGTFQVMPIPAYKPGSARAQLYPTTFSGKMFAVSSKAKDPEALVKLIDWMYSEQGSNLMNFGVEGVHYTLDDKGQPQLKKSYVDRFVRAQPTPYYALYSDLGCCQLSFTPWYSNTMSQFQIEKMTGNWDALNEQYWQIVASDPAYGEQVMEPPLTKQEAARVQEINNRLNFILNPEYDKFMMGLKPIGEYDAVIASVREQGAGELESIYNSAMSRMIR